jgi:hypothetical protein
MPLKVLFGFLLGSLFTAPSHGQGLRHPELDMRSFSGENGGVVMFMSPECPMCIQYAKTLRHLVQDFRPRGVSFTAVFPIVGIDSTQAVDFIHRFGLEMSVRMDHSLKITSYFVASVTPEVFILNSKGEVYYHGSVDDWYYALGRKKVGPKLHYARDCLTAMLDGLPAPYYPTKALGCYIKAHNR